jgi:hypothetical protein
VHLPTKASAIDEDIKLKGRKLGIQDDNCVRLIASSSSLLSPRQTLTSACLQMQMTLNVSIDDE